MSYIVQLRFTNLNSAIDFYVEKLGCVLEFLYEDYYAGVRFGEQLMHFKLVDEPEVNVDWVRLNEHLHLMFPVVDIHKEVATLRSRGVLVSDMRDQPWGQEVTVIDPGGHTLFLSQLI